MKPNTHCKRIRQSTCLVSRYDVSSAYKSLTGNFELYGDIRNMFWENSIMILSTLGLAGNIFLYLDNLLIFSFFF